MRDDECASKSDVLIYIAALLRIAHAVSMSDSERSTRNVMLRADVVAGQQDCVVVVENSIFISASGINVLRILPRTKIMEGCFSAMHKRQVGIVFDQNYDTH